MSNRLTTASPGASPLARQRPQQGGERLRDLRGSHRGECPVTLEMVRPGGESVAVAPSAYFRVRADQTLRAEVEGLLGPGSVVLARTSGV